MPCFHPLKGWIGRDGKFTQNSKKTWIDKREEVQIPCGKCLGCKLEYSRQWAIRCQHEMMCHYENSFITLTYDDEHLPKRGVSKKHCQDFFKLLRYHLQNNHEFIERMKFYRARDPSPISEIGLRYFGCSEYGERTLRPHYHFILFGFSPSDLELVDISTTGHKLFRSEYLSNIWGKGNVIVGESCNFDTASYVARYVVKNQKMEELLNNEYFKILNKTFVLSSRRPAIGLGAFENSLEQIKRLDKVSVKTGVICNPPRYYDKKLKERFPLFWEKIKANRLAKLTKKTDFELYNELEIKEILTDKRVFKERNL